MKKRANYILEQLDLHYQRQENRHNSNQTALISNEKINDIDYLNESGKENILLSPSTDSRTGSPSIIENTPDRSIPYDSSTILQYNRITKKARTLKEKPDGAEEMLTVENVLPPNQINQKCQRIRTASSSSPSSTSDSSSSSSSSSSTSNDDTLDTSIAKTKVTLNDPSTPKLTNQASSGCASKKKKEYYQSPINSNKSDVDLSGSDPTFLNRRRLSISSTTSSTSSSTHLSTPGPDSANNSVLETTRQSRKRVRDSCNGFVKGF